MNGLVSMNPVNSHRLEFEDGTSVPEKETNLCQVLLQQIVDGKIERYESPQIELPVDKPSLEWMLEQLNIPKDKLVENPKPFITIIHLIKEGENLFVNKSLNKPQWLFEQK